MGAFILTCGLVVLFVLISLGLMKFCEILLQLEKERARTKFKRECAEIIKKSIDKK